PGYVAWLPDRQVTLYREGPAWRAERLQTLGASPAHQALWKLLDRLAVVFWRASRNGIKLPVQSPRDILRAVQALGFFNLPLAHYVGWTMGEALQAFNLRQDRPLVGLLSMLIEDTVHSTVDQ